jgi:hypothetical protein
MSPAWRAAGPTAMGVILYPAVAVGGGMATPFLWVAGIRTVAGRAARHVSSGLVRSPESPLVVVPRRADAESSPQGTTSPRRIA